MVTTQPHTFAVASASARALSASCDECSKCDVALHTTDSSRASVPVRPPLALARFGLPLAHFPQQPIINTRVRHSAPQYKIKAPMLNAEGAHAEIAHVLNVPPAQ